MPNNPAQTAADAVRKTILDAYHKAVQAGTLPAGAPEGFDVIRLPAAEYLMFQGEPFAEEDYCQAIEEVQAAMKKFDPSGMGYVWDESNPRIQLEPFGARGYIELAPVCKKRP